MDAQRKEVNDSEDRKRTMKLSLRDGGAFNVMDYFGTAFFEAFIVSLGFAATSVAYIITIPQFITSLFNFFSQRIISSAGRYKTLIFSVMIQALALVPLTLLGFIPIPSSAVKILLLTIVLSIYYSAGTMAGNSWFALIGDIVPDKVRGKYFGLRTQIMTWSALISLIIAGLIINKLYVHIGMFAFAIIFIVAIIARIYSFTLVRQQYDPPHEELELKDSFSLWRFLARFKKSNFSRYAIFYAMFMFGVYLAAPVLTFYELKVLHLEFIQYTILKVTFMLGTILSLSIWGSLSDNYGNRIVFFITSFFASITIGLWAFIQDVHYLYVVEFFSGIVWAGLNLASANYTLDAVSNKKRTIIYSYLYILRGFAILFSGALALYLLSAWNTIPFIDEFSTHFATSFQFIFFISALLRALTVFAFFWLVREVRTTKRIDPRELLYFPSHGFRMIRGTISAGFNPIKPIKGALVRIERHLDKFEEHNIKKILSQHDLEYKILARHAPGHKKKSNEK